MTMVDTDITGESAYGNFALPTNLDIGETGCGVQFQRRVVFSFRLRFEASYPVTFVLF